MNVCPGSARALRWSLVCLPFDTRFLDDKRLELLGGKRTREIVALHDITARSLEQLVSDPEAAPLIEAAYGKLVPVQRAGDMPEAVRLAQAAAQPGDTVLLAPGCSSFDMFSS